MDDTYRRVAAVPASTRSPLLPPDLALLDREFGDDFPPLVRHWLSQVGPVRWDLASAGAVRADAPPWVATDFEGVDAVEAIVEVSRAVSVNGDVPYFPLGMDGAGNWLMAVRHDDDAELFFFDHEREAIVAIANSFRDLVLHKLDEFRDGKGVRTVLHTWTVSAQIEELLKRLESTFAERGWELVANGPQLIAHFDGGRLSADGDGDQLEIFLAYPLTTAGCELFDAVATKLGDLSGLVTVHREVV